MVPFSTVCGLRRRARPAGSLPHWSTVGYRDASEHATCERVRAAALMACDNSATGLARFAALSWDRVFGSVPIKLCIDLSALSFFPYIFAF